MSSSIRRRRSLIGLSFIGMLLVLRLGLLAPSILTTGHFPSRYRLPSPEITTTTICLNWLARERLCSLERIGHHGVFRYDFQSLGRILFPLLELVVTGLAISPEGSDRTHAVRRGLILAAHPEVRDLFGGDAMTLPITAGIFVAQTGLAALMGWLGLGYWPLALVTAIAFGAFANHANFVVIHDAIHNLVFKSRTVNRLTAILADLPNGIPTAMGFRVYHLKHHAHLSTYDRDPDVPSRWEVVLVGNSSWRKAAWLFFFPLVQLARIPRIEGQVPFWRPWMFANIVAVVAFDAFLVLAFGPNALVYLLLSFWFSVGGLHPLSARWLQEHFGFGPDQGTFDYYGPLNKIALNIGYHNEHHDFPEIPWSRLPQLKAMAPEFYRSLRSQSSWTRLLIMFIRDPAYSLATRSSNVQEAVRAAGRARSALSAT